MLPNARQMHRFEICNLTFHSFFALDLEVGVCLLHDVSDHLSRGRPSHIRDHLSCQEPGHDLVRLLPCSRAEAHVDLHGCPAACLHIEQKARCTNVAQVPAVLVQEVHSAGNGNLSRLCVGSAYHRHRTGSGNCWVLVHEAPEHADLCHCDTQLEHHDLAEIRDWLVSHCGAETHRIVQLF